MRRHGGAWGSPVLLCLALLAATGGQGPPVCREQDVSAGGMLELLPEKPPLGWARLEWRLMPEGGGYQRILTADKSGVTLPSKSSYSGRAEFQRDSLSLRLSRLRVADSGVYQAEFEDASGVFSRRCFRVSVWEPVQQPRLEPHVQRWEQGRCNLSLLCTVPGPGNFSYHWSCTRDVLGALEEQPRLHLQVHGDGDPTVCRCNASNPVSWSTASIDVVAACRAEYLNTFPWWAVALSLGLALAFSVALAVTCYWQKRRGKDPSRAQDEQTLTIYEEVGKARTGQDPRGTGEVTAGGNTIYAVISDKTQRPSCPQDPASCTIYSVVQPTRKPSSVKKKRLDPALVSTAYVEATGISRRWCPPSQTSPPSPASHHLS